MLVTALALLLAAEAPSPGTAENPFTCWQLETMRLAVTVPADTVIARAEILFEDSLAEHDEEAILARIVIEGPESFPPEAAEWVFPIWTTVKELPDCHFTIRMRWSNDAGGTSAWSEPIYVKKRWAPPPVAPIVRFEVQTFSVATQP